ncbi:MAG: cytochrome c oxidase subunit II [Acetobacteraceae bacterium]|nr:cytochrome c oxidase subunit II [Acetobacteraceae bacterium]
MTRPMQVPRRLGAAALIGYAFSALPCASAFAQAPRPWAVGLQEPFSPVQRDIISLNHLVLVIISLITAFVGALLAWVIWRYNARRHPVAAPLSHNTPVEIAWTVVPILILVVIAIPSFRLVFYQDRTDHPDMTIKVTGHQWYWEYTYPDEKNLDFSSYIIPDDKLKPGQLRLLTVDNDLVLPVGKNIRLLQTSGDVIHSFFIPSLGVQRYAIPGRTIETWVRIDKPGVYRGECNQICGTNHSRMPIVVRGVSPEEFQAWVAQAQKQFADTTPAPPQGGIQLASATEARR